ncbi:Hypothetical predicted protein [Pelobates cultripes]|uniref:Uncharacterized protein n=1 Tax=Pelobates cultripes TaxID=61616 RepID=A0AAD1SBM4_PELCU|nr:Hypothetical predicted protein [Pelobates cultripes]
MTASPTEVNSLDVHIYKNQSELAYTLYTKATDRNTILKADSFHPKPLKESLPLSQFMRVVRNNYDPVNTPKQIKEMWTKFRDNSYKDSTLQQVTVITDPICQPVM